jgi:transglutaminase-like putative cysteine protease
VAGLVLIVAAFAIPAAARPTPAPALWGIVLFLLVAAWLWGSRARTLPALALLAGFGAAAIPVASGLADQPAIDYRTWTLPGAEHANTFDWEPGYGPIDWPRDGELLFRVRAERPSFWRTTTLDEFYGDGWRRSGTGGATVPGEPRPGFPKPDDPASMRTAKIEVLDLESPLLISPGAPVTVRGGISGFERDGDGTIRLDEPLEPGASYTVTAWAPDPDPRELRTASQSYPRALAPYTSLALPADASLEAIAAPDRIDVPLWGSERGDPAAALTQLRSSVYAPVFRLAERLTAGAPDAYDATVAVNDHLRTAYSYDERPPERRLPLRAFLFQDRIGYCQQFSGAMALMLRMVGIPARVATGFAPGTPLADGKGFEVTDLEAHSWVEVYFDGIGWLPFDPTPPTNPASLEIRGGASFGIDAGDLGGAAAEKARERARAKASAGGPDARAGGGGGPLSPPLGIAAALSASLFLVPPIRSLRHRRLPPADAADLETTELRRLLQRTGWAQGSATMLAVEGRLWHAHHGAAAAYVRRYRERIYSTAGAPRPTLAERRRMRRDLSAGAGLVSRLRLLALVPPGAPRRRRSPGEK